MTTGIYTDGACDPNPGRGGWAWVWIEDDRIRQLGAGHEAQTTNNRMEIAAIIAALRALPEDVELTLYSDSKLAINTITAWGPRWEADGWVRMKGPPWKRTEEPVKNLDLVKPLLALARAHPGIRYEHVPGHAGVEWNEYVDKLSVRAAGGFGKR